MENINCFNCTHFYITWDKHFPYGCRIMGVKSRYMPSYKVYQASAVKCLGYKPKPQKEKISPRKK